jgi:hypothetical protein
MDIQKLIKERAAFCDSLYQDGALVVLKKGIELE